MLEKGDRRGGIRAEAYQETKVHQKGRVTERIPVRKNSLRNAVLTVAKIEDWLNNTEENETGKIETNSEGFGEKDQYPGT